MKVMCWAVNSKQVSSEVIERKRWTEMKSQTFIGCLSGDHKFISLILMEKQLTTTTLAFKATD